MDAQATDRLNLIAWDVFWLRWGRDYEPGGAEDDQRLGVIHAWILECGPLPTDGPDDTARRIATLRGLVQLTGGM